jgi:hypothetical protein
VRWVVVAVVGVACVAAAAVAVTRGSEEPTPVLVDERSGELHGVRFGDSEDDVRALLGVETDDAPGFFPEGAQYTGPVAIPSPASDRDARTRPVELHFRDLAYLVSPTAGVYSMATLEAGARTRAGVGVGDSLPAARDRYSGAECGAAPRGESLTGGEQPTCGWCRVVVGDVRVFFGGDPIVSITMTSDP